MSSLVSALVIGVEEASEADAEVGVAGSLGVAGRSPALPSGGPDDTVVPLSESRFGLNRPDEWAPLRICSICAGRFGRLAGASLSIKKVRKSSS